LAGDGKDSIGLPELLFSMASDDRLALLAELNSKPQKMTPLSKTINASVQECSRHLERLSTSGLVSKGTGGYFSTTSLGRAVIRMFPGMKFLLSNREYFLTHDPGYLPEAFVERLGELSTGEYVNHVSRTLELIKEVISEGREFVWLVADQPPIVSKVAGDSFRSRELRVKLIAEIVDKKTLTNVRSALRNGEVVLMKDVRVAMAINESRAGVCFPDLRGKPDFGAGFTGTDGRFMKWCRDLFDHYWAQATNQD
jgi:predicted transcriptional regulator